MLCLRGCASDFISDGDDVLVVDERSEPPGHVLWRIRGEPAAAVRPVGGDANAARGARGDELPLWTHG